MRTFVDSLGRPWILNVTVATVRRCKSVVDLTEPETFIEDVYRNPCRLAEIVYAICAPNTSLSLDDLDQVLKGEAIGKLRADFLDEMIDFFQDRTGRGELLSAMVAVTNKTIQQEMQKAVVEITKTSTGSSENSELTAAT